MATKTIDVTTFNDQNDLNFGDDFSLREAILDANIHLNDDYIIRLQGGATYSLTIEGDEDFGESGDLDIFGNVTIEVTGSGLATIKGNGSDRIFHVFGTLNLNDTKITGGHHYLGGGGIVIAEDGSATLNNTIVSGNSTTGIGGGIANGGDLIIHNTTVANNSADGTSGIINSGGGIINIGNIDIIDSTVNGNYSLGSGAGLMNIGGIANINNTTFIGNSGDDGGAIANTFGTSNIVNSTFIKNSARESGGAIYNDFGETNLTNVTITENIADSDNNGSGNGGGISSFFAITTNIESSIISGNLDTPNNLGDGDIHPDVSGDITGSASNIIGTIDGATGSIGTGSDKVGINPLLETPIFRLQSLNRPGTYLFTGDSEKEAILSNPSTSDQFVDEGFAFNVGIAPGDDLIGLYRFQNKALPGTYVYVGTEERDAILNNPNFSQTFSLEGLAFSVYGAGSGKGLPLYRLQSLTTPGTYIFAGQEERDAIFANPAFASSFNDEGVAFEVSTF